MGNDSSSTSSEKSVNLNDELREILIESFEARGFSLVFHTDHVCAIRDGKTEIIPYKVVLQYVRAFGGSED